MENKKVALTIYYINGTAKIFSILSTPCDNEFYICDTYATSSFYLPINEAVDIVSRLGIYERWA